MMLGVCSLQFFKHASTIRALQERGCGVELEDDVERYACKPRGSASQL